MTGREMIIYILQNNLEDVDIFSTGYFIGFMTLEEAAVKFGVTTITVQLWYEYGFIKGIKMGNTLLIRKDSVDPLKAIDQFVTNQSRG